ncbi:MAG: hypothetical protein IJS46_04945, partial [Kiritimatiellae bacterium]|nr:hypothetical protein [Kiritimatiellia bacterium]
AVAGAPAAAAAPTILRPAAGAALRLPGEAPWSVAVEIAGVKAGETLWWTLDGVPCGAQDSEKPFFAPVRSPGTHTVGFSTAEGETAAVEFSVTSPSERPKRPR